MEKLWETEFRNEEPETDLVQILVDVLRHIKPLLIVACVCAVLLGGGKLISGGSGAKTQAEYTRELELYQVQAAAYEEQLAQAREAIARNREAQENSVLLNLDSQHFFQREAAWYVDTHYQVGADFLKQDVNPISAVMGAYERLMTGDDFYAYMNGRLVESIDPRYLSELISVDADSDTAILRLAVFGADERMADEIYDAAKAYLEDLQTQICGSVHDYDIALIGEWSYDASDSGVSKIYSERVSSVEGSYNDSLNALNSTVANLQSGLSALMLPQAPGIMGSLRDAVKYAAIGFLLGLVLAALYFVIRFVTVDPAVSERELSRRYGLTVLASLRRFTGKSPWQRMLSRLSGDAKRTDTPEETAALARANIAALLEASGRGGERALLVGRNREQLSEMARLFGEESGVSAGGDIMADEAAVEKLRGYENVVLVEKKEDTPYREIGGELERLLRLKKNVIGIITL